VGKMTKQEEYRIYYLQNRDRILERKKELYKINKEKILMKNKEYRLNNKEKRAETQRKYNQSKAIYSVEEVIENAKNIKTKYKYLGDYLK